MRNTDRAPPASSSFSSRTFDDFKAGAKHGPALHVEATLSLSFKPTSLPTKVSGNGGTECKKEKGNSSLLVARNR
jgi:hypothetical protein